MKNKRPRTEPCGTPHFMVCIGQKASLIELNKLIAITKVAFYPLQGRVTDAIVAW